jgi:uncharacterized protein YdaU (DUF1376 family)
VDSWLLLKPSVMAFWTLDGRTCEWTQKRMLKERDFVEKSRRQKRKAAIKRWAKTKNDDAAACEPHVQPTPTPTPTRKNIESSSSDDAGQAMNGHSHEPRQAEISRAFDEQFWPSYPRRKGKAAAKAKFIARAKACGVGAILDGLERAKAEWRRKGTEPDYIPHPATWLNQGRWEDEPDRPPIVRPPERAPMPGEW